MGFEVNACLLVATPQMTDPGFSQAVILVVEHNPFGALGFIINRPSPLSLKNMVHFDERAIPPEVPAWYGGPVDTTTGIVLHNQPLNPGDKEIAPQIALSSSPQTLHQIADEAEHRLAQLQGGNNIFTKRQGLYPFRFVVGYAGWGARQLDDEIRTGAWLVQPLDQHIIFYSPWQEMWSHAIKKAGPSMDLFFPTAHQPYLN